MKPIGIVKHVEENDIIFISSQKLKKGDFVAYKDRWVDSDRFILCRVRYARSLKEYPDEFLMDDGLDPKEILEFSGMDAEDYKKYLITASIVGYYSSSFKEFKHPRTMPDFGAPVYLADNEMLKDISPVQAGSQGSATIGVVLGTDVPVALSVKDLASQHLSIIAATGSGKSYTVGVLLEELMRPINRAAVLVVDPHGEYSTLSDIQNKPEFNQDGYRPTVKILRKDNIKIKITELTLEDFLGILEMTEKMETFFIRAFNALPDRSNYKKVDLLNEVRALRDENNQSTIDGIIWRFERNIMNRPIFDDFQHMQLKEQFSVGQLTILDLSGLSQKEQQLIVAVLLRRLFDARENTVNQRYGEKDEKHLPYPVFVVLEEAHRFAPQNGEAKSKNILKTILSEGRKFGIGVCMVSQRPSKLDSDCLSQCMSQITMRIINPVDRNQIGASIESMSNDMLDELPGLAKGEALVSGVAINTPTLVKVRERLTAHGGISPDAPSEWIEYSKKAMASKQAVMAQRKQYRLF
ncbi:ATP-binding protein [Methanocella conradii]|uniref:ATP-binding protein n=1 Tax=Methanocella conradii TaxID=1175444 RepID=UPI00157BCFB1|nr:ATP-binding protein [Methanocella conradii]